MRFFYLIKNNFDFGTGSSTYIIYKMLSSITRRTALRLSQQGIRARSSLISSSTFLSRSLSSSSSSSTSTSTSSTSSSSTSTPSPPLVDTTVGTAETHGFQAETKQLLNIVANALYTDKHVFVR